ncbi:rRNA-processing protein EBP2 [Elasticomyces elasticus]|nr:rRNA-processing protein EBP2 [Elasticomyces elasticus]KAK3668075.1 rRNA-processing protein EBP2 [Elasticomyces elasticus]KAK4925223.1 rRNA-processing protein EBP2 [Elasticomyces elasticus]KAK5767715.1 rRNA-processing protein EBP2 [Elasticomyces elasticus]
MPQKERKLKAALERSKGVNYDKERQKKLRKEAEKQKSKKQRSGINLNALENATEVGDAEISNGGDAEIAAKKWAALTGKAKGDADGLEMDEEDDAELFGEGEEDEEDDDVADIEGGVIIETFEDESESDSDEDQTFYTAAATSPQKVMTNDDAEEEGEDDEEEEEIPLSDIESLASEDKGDVIPYQRLTINNTAALQRSLKSFALPDGLPFTATQAVSSAEPIEIADVEDDLNRELSFYQQSLHAVKEARIQLKKEGVPFSRPADYFAEMVKSEEQMGKVRQKMVDEAARKKASSDARRQRDLKKFGKAVQIAKLQERDRTKRDTLDKIGALKRKRAGGNDLTAKEDDMFDVALEDAATTEKGDRAARKSKAGRDGGSRRGGDEGPNRKRAKKDEKFGFGGKKRFSKSNDAKSTAESDGYNVKKMKGGKGAMRPGKSKRAKRV